MKAVVIKQFNRYQVGAVIEVSREALKSLLAWGMVRAADEDPVATPVIKPVVAPIKKARARKGK